ncbi:hypothetical protein ANO11243_080560 [Dothideomycetidae sp. 11243]|nr:hypothetical protein ANO11243_080560 [fungal sp. No.11243]
MIEGFRREWLLYTALVLLPLGCVLLVLETLWARRKVNCLGGPARALQTSRWNIWGVSFLWTSMAETLKHNDLAYWGGLLKRWGAPLRPWTIETSACGIRIIYTADEDNMKELLTSKFKCFEKGSSFRKDFEPLLGGSIFTTDGQQWRNYRKFIQPHLKKERLFHKDMLEERMQVFLPMLASSTSVQASIMTLRLTLDVFSDSFFGDCADTLRRPNEELRSAFTGLQRYYNLMLRAGPLQVCLNHKEFRDNINTLNKFVEPMVGRTLAIREKSRSNGTTAKDVAAEDFHIQRGSVLQNLAAITSDTQVIRDQLVNVLVAGKDSTSNTMSWTLYHLAMQPHLVKRLREEIFNTVGDRLPTAEDLKLMTFLKFVVNETLRLYPPLPFNGRIASADTTLPRGGGDDGLSPIGVPKGTMVSFSTLLLHREADLYPPLSSDFPDPKDFAPERWERWTPSPWAYMPFSRGPRMCPAQDFAMTYMSYVLVRILQTYERIECPMDAYPGEKYDMQISPYNSIELSFHKA